MIRRGMWCNPISRGHPLRESLALLERRNLTALPHQPGTPIHLPTGRLAVKPSRNCGTTGDAIGGALVPPLWIAG